MELVVTEQGVSFAVKVVPRAKKNEIVGVEGDALKVRLTAPPVEGKANAVLVEFLAEVLGVRRANVEIVAGETARRKIVRVRGVEVQVTREKLGM
jgi:uncharacterized protein (TIGR00251 family)